MNNLRYSTQTITKTDIKAVKKVLYSDWLTQGPKALEFEKSLCKFTSSKYCVAVNSGSSALLIACKSLNLSKNDYIWTVPNTFVATANSILLSGQKIDFVDIDKNTFNLSIDLLEKKLKKAKKNNSLPKAIIIVHLAGLPVNPLRLKKLSKIYNFYIIEDASHSLGAKYFNKKVGSCIWSDLCIFSFHPVKIITSAEGGCVTTNNKKFYERMLLYRNNGIEKNKRQFIKKNTGPWYYEQQSIGYNFRLNDIQAALGISQLKKINLFLKKRNKIAKFYKDNLKNLPLNFQLVGKNFYSSYHLFIIQINKNFKKYYKNLFLFLRKNNLLVNLHYLPVHLHPFYRRKGFKKKSFPISEQYSETSISIPIYPNLSLKNQIKVIKLVKLFFKKHEQKK